MGCVTNALGELASNAKPGASLARAQHTVTYRGVKYFSERHIIVNKSNQILTLYWSTGLKEPSTNLSIQPNSGSVEIGTYAFHVWTLRPADGSFAIQWTGSASIVEVLPGNFCKITRISDVVEAARLSHHPAWGRWQQRGYAMGMPIMAYDCVCQRAVDVAGHIACKMMQHCPPHIITAMQQAGAQLGVISRAQVVTDMPTHGYLKHCADRNIDLTCRGLGATRSNPITTASEENLLMLPGCMFASMSVLVHELGHAVMNIALDEATLRRVYAAYCDARDVGLYPEGCYCMVNEQEYWAAAVEAWFESTVRLVSNGGVNKRDVLVGRDAVLAGIVREVFGDGDWRFWHDCPGELIGCCEEELGCGGGGGGDGVELVSQQMADASLT